MFASKLTTILAVTALVVAVFGSTPSARRPAGSCCRRTRSARFS
jgi:hypothetical protein